MRKHTQTTSDKIATIKQMNKAGIINASEREACIAAVQFSDKNVKTILASVACDVALFAAEQVAHAKQQQRNGTRDAYQALDVT